MPNIPEASLNFTWGGNFKSITDQGILEGDGIVFGSETDHDRSSFKDFFTSDTFVHPEDEFTTSLFMEHGFHYRNPIGKAKMFKSESGWKVHAELNLEDPEVKSKFNDIKKGGWGFSTGAVSHVVQRDKKSNGTHHIKQWAVGELSITKTPAEPKALVHSVKSMDAYYNGELGSPMNIEEEDNNNMEFNDKVLEKISMMVQEISSIKEMMMQWNEQRMAEENSEFEGGEESNQENDSNEEKLTVLKSIYDELQLKNIELQSSFNEKEALLSEKMVLLSETQAELEAKSQEIQTLEEALIDAKANIENLKKALETEKRVNIALGSKNFNK